MNFQLRIYGRPVSGAAALDVINPATEEGLAEAPRADLCSCSRRRRQGRRRRLATTRGRRALLVRLADALKARKDEFARLLAVQQLRRFPRLTERNTQMVVRVIRDARRREVLPRTLPP